MRMILYIATEALQRLVDKVDMVSREYGLQESEQLGDPSRRHHWSSIFRNEEEPRQGKARSQKALLHLVAKYKCQLLNTNVT